MGDMVRRVAASYLRGMLPRTAKINYKPVVPKVLEAFRQEDYDELLAFFNRVLADQGDSRTFTWGENSQPIPSLYGEEWFQALGPRMQKRVWKVNDSLAKLFRTLDRFRQFSPDKKKPETFSYYEEQIQSFLKELIWLGSVMIHEDKEGEAFRHGRFTIIPMKGISKAELEKCLQALDEAVRLCKQWFPQVLYGKIYINKAISDSRKSTTLAHYVPGTDVMTLSMKLHKGHVVTILHELGHRYDFKFMSPEQRGRFNLLTDGVLIEEDVFTTQEARALSSRVEGWLRRKEYFGAVGELMESGLDSNNHKSRKVFELIRAMKRGGSEPDDLFIQSIKNEIMAIAPAKFERRVELGSPLHVTTYGQTSYRENFAEGFAYFLAGKPLPHKAMGDFFENL